ncbi:MAG: type II secretion system protein M [Gammaproteobacteria bacterium]|nr:type II secretion system protein M [Gammaproteobacteria bacterium]
MALVAEQGNNRLTAILLLVIVLILVYLLCFHWFIIRHIDYGAEISDLSEQLGRFQRVAAQKTQYETLLQSLQDRKSDTDLFLEGDDFNEAAAGMSERLGQMIRTQAEDNCQIVSRQPVRPRVQERFQKVTVNVRMRCGIEDLKKVLYSLESGVPMVVAEEVTVIKPRARRRRGNNQEAESQTLLDIRFNMSGYLREPA